MNNPQPNPTQPNPTQPNKTSTILLLVVFWLYVLIPLAWGVWSTLKKAAGFLA